jgi:hypothetical protein
MIWIVLFIAIGWILKAANDGRRARKQAEENRLLRLESEIADLKKN